MLFNNAFRCLCRCYLDILKHLKLHFVTLMHWNSCALLLLPFPLAVVKCILGHGLAKTAQIYSWCKTGRILSDLTWWELGWPEMMFHMSTKSRVLTSLHFRAKSRERRNFKYASKPFFSSTYTSPIGTQLTTQWTETKLHCPLCICVVGGILPNALIPERQTRKCLSRKISVFS